MNKVETKTENYNESLFEELSNKYLPFWPMAAFLVFIFLIIAAVYLRYTTPVYEITATLLITDERKGADENAMVESLNLLSSKKIVENEVEVIHSRKIMDSVVKKLHLYAPTFEEGKVKPASAYTSSPVTIEVDEPDKLQETDAVYFTYDSLKKAVIIDKKEYALNQFVATPYGNLKFTANKRFSKSTERPIYFVLLRPKIITAALVDKLDVAPASKLSSIVNLKIHDEVPKRGEDILNVLLEKYRSSGIDYKNELAKNTIAFVNERLNVVSKELNAVEKRIQNYKAKKGIVNLSDQGKMYLQNVGDNDQKLGDVNLQLDVLNQVERYVLAKDTSAGIVPSTLGVNDPLLSKLLDRLYQSEIDYNRLKKTTAENNPLLQSIADQIEGIRPGILENIRNQRATLLAGLSNLTNVNKSYNSVLQTLPEKERELVEVSRDQSIKNNVYSFLLQKREETALAYASNVANSKIVEDAQSSIFAVSPKETIIYLAAIMLAFAFTIGYVTIKELISNKILFRKEIENNTGIPVIAEISNFNNSSSLSKARDNRIIQDQFRQLRAGLGMLSKTNTIKKILITSGIAGDGKSFISSNLALSLSFSGKKVVLIDMDLRNAQISKVYQQSKTSGICEFLEKDVQPQKIIKRTEDQNLFIIAAGETKENPTELLLNGKLQELFLYLEEIFDFIIIDTSSIHKITDAYILSEFCDVTLYVIRQEFTPKATLKKFIEIKQLKSLGNISIVFNGIKPRGIFKGSLDSNAGYQKIDYAKKIKSEYNYRYNSIRNIIKNKLIKKV